MMPTHSKARRALLPWLTVGVACIGLAGFTWWHAHTTRAPADAGGAHLAPAAPATPALDARPARPVVRHDAPSSRDAAAASGQDEHVRVQAIVDRTRDTFAARYAAESVDTTWSNAMELDLASLADSDQIRAMHANVSNLDVDCRTTMCRVSGEVPSITAGDDWFTLYMTNVGAKLPQAAYHYVRNGNGPLRIEVFALARR